jgi:uncharacterized protein DUF4124
MTRVLAVLLLLCAAPAAAQIYKWVDDKGRVQYGEKPPPGAKATPLRSSPAQPQQPPASRNEGGNPFDAEGNKPRPSDDLAEQELAFRRRQIEREREEKKREEERLAALERCRKAKEDLEYSEDAAVLYRREGSKRVFLTREEQLAELARLRAEVKKHCR